MKYGCIGCTCAGKTMRDPGCICKKHELLVLNNHFNYFQEKPIHLSEPYVLNESKNSRDTPVNLSLEKVQIRRLDKKQFIIQKFYDKTKS
jgi:hypothetical protein